MPDSDVVEAVEAKIDTLVEHERKYIATVLRRLDGNRVATAAALGISTRGLQYIIARWRREGHDVPESNHSHSRNLPWAHTRNSQAEAQGAG